MPIKQKANRTEHTNDAGLLHREDGPAVEYLTGAEAWYLNGKQHRIGGPAVTFEDGSKEYWEHGKFVGREAAP